LRKWRADRVLCSIPRMAFPSTNRLAQVYDSVGTGVPNRSTGTRDIFILHGGYVIGSTLSSLADAQ
jgi:hypothetical protein